MKKIGEFLGWLFATTFRILVLLALAAVAVLALYFIAPIIWERWNYVYCETGFQYCVLRIIDYSMIAAWTLIPIAAIMTVMLGIFWQFSPPKAKAAK